MSSYNFADRYRAAGLAPGHEIIALRQVPFDNLRKDADVAIILDLTRLYFGLPVVDGAEWFREAFAETDLSFSMIDNEREASVLSACLLGAIIDDGNVFAAIAPLVAAAGGARTPLSSTDLLEYARQAVAKYSVASRQAQSVDVTKIKLPAKGKAAAAMDAVVQTPEWASLGEVVKTVSSESLEATKTLTNQIFSVVKPLAAQVRDLQEEVSMLWWYIGGWSRALEKPFTELDIGTSALMAGLDLGNLVQGESGPAAAAAILHRLVVTPRTDGQDPLSLDVAVDSVPFGTFPGFEFIGKISQVGDLCPVLCALSKAEEVGTGSAWHAAFKKITGLEASMTFTPLELAMQVYRESLLIAQVE